MKIRKHSDLLIGLLSALVIGLVLYGLDVQSRVALNKSVRGQVAEELEAHHHLVESWLNAAFYLPRGLVAYIGTDPELSRREPLVGMVAELFRFHGGIKAVVLAPEGGQWLRYSPRGLPVSPVATEALSPTVREAVERRRSILIEKWNEGSAGTTVHIPVYVPSVPGEDGDRYWGRILVELDLQVLFERVTLRSIDMDLDLAIQDMSGGEGHIGMLSGDQGVFDQEPVTMEVTFPGGLWRLGAVPTGGWNAAMPALLWLQVASLVVVVLVGLGVFLYLRDQAESRRKLEQALKSTEQARVALAESETFLKVIVENIPDMIFVKDAGDLRFVRMNKAGEELLGYPREDLLGKNDYDFFPAEEADHFTAYDRQVLNNRKLIDVPQETVQTREQGTRYLHTKKIPLLDAHGNPAYLMGISRDITEQINAQQEKERLEGQLRQSLKMESIGTLAGGIAHDFNNILAAILGYAEFALEEAGSNENTRLAISQVIKAGNRARDLVRHILSFSRKEAREAAPIELRQVMDEALGLLRASIPANIEFDLDVSASGRVMADPTQIHQVVMNICTNAAQAMREGGGLLSIQLSPVTLEEGQRISDTEVRPGDYMRLRVSDTGCGIPPELVDRIFDPYFTTKPLGEGTGMGLAVVMGIVKSHEGLIAVDSALERGTTIDVYLPLLESEAEEPVVAPPAQSAGLIAVEEGTILVMDDEPLVADVTRLTVEQLGYKATAVTDVEQALELFRSRPGDFKMLITDQNMPRMSGEALARAVLAMRPDLPVVMCTGYSAGMDADKARQAGIQAFIMKPLDRRELAGILGKLLGPPARPEPAVQSWREPVAGRGS